MPRVAVLSPPHPFLTLISHLPQIPFSTPLAYSYFPHLSSAFDQPLREGMRLYFEYAAKCGLIEPVGELEDMTEAVGAR